MEVGVMIRVVELYSPKKNYDDFDDNITAKIALGIRLIKVCVIYNKPRTNKIEFIKSLDDYLEQNNSSDMRFIICGDFIINAIEVYWMIKNYRNVISSNGFELEAEQATRITDKNALAWIIVSIIILLNPVLNSWNMNIYLIIF